MMQAHGQATVWETYLGIGRARDAKGWYQQLRSWSAARAAARRQAQPVALDASWDAQHEAVRPLRADAAQEMAAAQGVLSVATILYGLSQ